jgi:uncharacterized protein YaaQ
VKLVIAVIHNRDRNRVIDDLVRAGFKFTILSSTGGFLREGNTTLLTAVEDSEVSTIMELIQQNCRAREQLVNVVPPETSAVGAFVPSPVKVPVGGAIAWVVNVEQFERF